MSGCGLKAPQMSRSGCEPYEISVIDPEAVQDIEEWSVGPHGCREWSGTLPDV